MKLQMQEVACAFKAMNVNKEGKPRNFPFSQLGKVAELSKKMAALLKTEGETTFIPPGDHELDLTTDEKAMLKANVEELDWNAGDAEHVVKLVEKLA